MILYRFEGYMTRGSSSYNVIICDWTSMTRTFNYYSAVASTPVAGKVIAKMLTALKKSGKLRSFEDVHIIGII
jgi:hypothetical protein